MSQAGRCQETPVGLEVGISLTRFSAMRSLSDTDRKAFKRFRFRILSSVTGLKPGANEYKISLASRVGDHIRVGFAAGLGKTNKIGIKLNQIALSVVKA
jgi:hypothetical protein